MCAFFVKSNVLISPVCANLCVTVAIQILKHVSKLSPNLMYRIFHHINLPQSLIQHGDLINLLGGAHSSVL